jgi:hypothetical protein
MTATAQIIQLSTYQTAAELEPQVLRPWNRAEAITTQDAAVIAGKTARTIRGWCHSKSIGRTVGGTIAVSCVALEMHLCGDDEALSMYLAGDRGSPIVRRYFARCDVPLPLKRLGAS